MENNYSDRKQRNSSGHVTRRKKSNMYNGKVTKESEKQVSKINEVQLNHDKVTEELIAANSSIDVCDKTGRNKKTNSVDNGSLWWILFCAVCLSSFGSRLYKIDQPDHICWDETHFGKMGSWYINRTFFFDVHPPLGKMLIGLSGYLTGYDGSFHFSKPGDKYENTPYVGMRVVCACMGACLAPLSFSITWLLSGSCGAALLSAAFIILDTGVLTLSQYILLDPILMIAIMLATWSLLKFYSYQNRPFSGLWWMWLLSTGFFLACAISVKFVGLFVVLLTGVTVAWDLWTMIGDLHVTLVQFTKHFLARALCLIVLPVMLYLVYFAIHFHVLNKSGNGDGFYSSAFQSQLQGNPLYNASMPAVVAYGSIVTIKNRRTAGAYLHSHPHLYPEGIGARQQQVTTYSHKDDNNKWRIKPHNREVESGEDVQLVTSGHLVRLEHVMTRRNLHSHRERAPLSRQHYQVTCYGENGTGDINDVFRLEIVGAAKGAPLQTVRSVFKLVHYSTGCEVFSHNKQLPKWGWEQLEVACNTHHSERKALWNIEEVVDNRLPNTSFQVYGPSFLEKLLESHAVMMQGNKNLKPKEGEVSSRPWQWPINYKGQPFSGGDIRIYLLGNPVIWWLNLFVMVMFCLFAVVQLIRRQRHPEQPLSANTQGVLCTCGWLILGWLLHYLPFWTMTRILYFHHYFPAFLYSCMTSGVFLDHLLNVTCRAVSTNKHHLIYATLFSLLLAAITYSFVLFSPLSYGMTGPSSRQDDSMYTHLRWLDTWDI